LQATLLNVVIDALVVFLFWAISSARPDDRLRCWLGGWVCILIHFGADLWSPSSTLWETVQNCVSVDALALAGILFAVSTMVLTEGRRTGLWLGGLLAISTVPCLCLAIIGLHSIWPLSIVLLARQVLAVSLAARGRRNRWVVTFIAVLVCLASSGWMCVGLIHGQMVVVISALLTEIYVVTAIDFWNNGWPHTLALNTMAAGLVAWAAVFPLGLLVHQLWPRFSVEPEIWNTPKLCVSIGMILVVLEEDFRASGALSEEYRLLFETNPHPLWIFEVETLRFRGVNQAALDLHGYTREEFLGLTLADILDPDLLSDARREVASPDPLPNRASRHIRKDGGVLPMDIASYNTVFQGKRCRFVMGIDVTEREELEQQLAYQSEHDFLTGLPNRILFHERLAEAIGEAVKTQEMLVVLCMDIIRLKGINDTYGIRAGDECVRGVARILEQHARSGDIVACTGSGEFAIVFGGIRSAAAAEQAAIDLREALSRPLAIQDHSIQLSFSVGLAICPVDGTEAVALWRCAESAQRQSRAAGDGQTVWSSLELNRAAGEQIELEAYMRTQLKEGGFHLFYQPLYGFDGAVHGLEALLRLNHPKYGALSPDRFVPIAEETGLIGQIGQWVIEEVCRQLQAWTKQGARLVPVAVNVSGLQLMHTDFAGRVVETLEQYTIDPQWIHLEITETAVMHDAPAVCERMSALAAYGIHFSIDDFGAGHSSLGRLHQLPISVLKVDRSFVDQLCVHNGAFSIVQAIISMAHALGQRVVAEGVETAEQLILLRGLQCDLLQGYLLSRPVPPDRIPALTAAIHPAFNLAFDPASRSGLPQEDLVERAILIGPENG
jgi:diguanylate cyclase (GGDEF)-like protein/PAS domain S-box-containing protein